MSSSPAQNLLATFAQEGAVDVTCHLGQWPFRLRATATVGDLHAYARRHGLRELWVSHLSSLFGFDTRTGNDACLAACASDSLFRVFAVLDPTDATWEDELAWACARGASGLRIAPGIHGYPLWDAIPIAAACRERGLPLQVLVRLDDARVRHPRFPARDPRPEEIAEFLRQGEGTTLLLSGLRWDEWQETLPHLADTPPEGVRLDLWHVNGPFRVADMLGAEPDRWVFGSGFPVQTPEATMLQVASSDLAGGSRDRILRANAAAILSATGTPPAEAINPV